ncbi:MAG: serine protease [Nanoarchaeota archaeon]|nr:serine protease [Nanoarchaeota archaeon]
MDKIEICKKLKESTQKILLFDGDKFAGFSGSGIVIKSDGMLLTANHVVAPCAKLINPRIFAHSAGGISHKKTEYRLRLFDVSFDIGMPNFAKPLLIDLAVLMPKEKINDRPYIETENELCVEGQDMFMAGFPDEISPPLNFNRMLNFENSELAKSKEQIEIFFSSFMCLIMIKSGMIGGIQKVNISGKSQIKGFEKDIKANGAVYWIDNGSNHGASGGPVVDVNGKLVGIICEKGLTTQLITENSGIKVPSGATMALSHHLITWALK